MKTKETCQECGIEFEDDLQFSNELNKRIWCNECTTKKWNDLGDRRPNKSNSMKENKKHPYTKRRR